MTPVPKKDTRKYRPIACTSILLKTFEKMLLSRISNGTEGNDIFQFAYKRPRSTLDDVAYLIRSIASALDKRCQTVRLAFLDYKNAFGCLDRAVLLNLLSENGVDSNIGNLLCDYFTDRTHFTYLGGKRSSSLPLN
ncbi:reverse transcriptase domain-containing protein [Streptococcus dysgalactiae]|uniref:reverse transcriptase domain-containing protein n=1 Tax=Streptococcus dysgalactiae TaxID=1334 RepID=UPI0019512940|nr:hypothetical protein [Streptococcus dysgalactiae subsp. equisimilis]